MLRKNTLLYSISIIIGFIIITILPPTFISVSLSNYGIIEENLSFTHTPTSPAPNQTLFIDADIGDIEIKYEYPPLNYVVKTDISIFIMGINLTGKTYLDMFTITCENTDSNYNITFKFKDEKWMDNPHLMIQNPIIIIYLNADYLFDINATIKTEGNLEVLAPWDIDINNIKANINEGKLLFDFFFCTINGNISGIVDYGNLELNTYNVKFAQNAKWNLMTDEADIKLIITQFGNMEGNLTGAVKTNTGEISIVYQDNSPDIGAQFTFHNYTGNWGGIYNSWVGFPETPDSFYDPPYAGYIFTSLDFPTGYNYNLSLYKPFTSGSYLVNLSSIPFN
ncbi:MAG: hypothetical protein ACW98D_09365 [Promethearchaeota archaeon]|jgi:hypothetical protein